MTDEFRQSILQQLLLHSDNGQLHRGAVNTIARGCGVHRNTVSSIWSRALESVRNGSGHLDISTQRHQCGRKKIDRTVELQRLEEVPLNQRGTIRASAAAIGMPTTSFFRMVMEGGVVRRTSSTKQETQQCVPHFAKSDGDYHST